MKHFYILLIVSGLCLISLGLLVTFKQTNFTIINIITAIGLITAYSADYTYKKLTKQLKTFTP